MVVAEQLEHNPKGLAMFESPSFAFMDTDLSAEEVVPDDGDPACSFWVSRWADVLGAAALEPFFTAERDWPPRVAELDAIVPPAPVAVPEGAFSVGVASGADTAAARTLGPALAGADAGCDRRPRFLFFASIDRRASASSTSARAYRASRYSEALSLGMPSSCGSRIARKTSIPVRK